MKKNNIIVSKIISCVVLLLIIIQHTLGQNDYLKNNPLIYSDDLNRLPKVKKEWKDYIIKNSIPFSSIISDDFKDLMFLKKTLKNKKYVFLGESGHLVKEYNEVKVRLIKFLVQELDFDVVVFESNIWDCYQLKFSKNYYTSREILDQTIYGAWRTPTLERLMSYIKKNNINLAGMDIKISSGNNSLYFEREVLSKIDTAIAKKSILLAKKYTNLYIKRSNNFYKKKLKNIDEYQETLKGLVKLNILLTNYQKTHIKNINLIVYQREIENRINMLKSIVQDDFDGYLDKRDSLMSATVIWLIKEIYPNKKVIFWAHNEHIMKHKIRGKKTMGEFLPDTIKKDSYVIGLYMFRGNTFDGHRIVKIPKPKKNSLEAIMIQPRYKYSFIDFSNLKYTEGSSRIFQKTISSYWGLNYCKEKIYPNKSFDAIIFIDKVSFPEHFYLKKMLINVNKC